MLEFLTEHSIFSVLAITLIIWLGIAFFLFKIDTKISKLEKVIKIDKK